MTQRNRETLATVATWQTLKCKTHSLQDRRTHPKGHQGCTCQQQLESAHGNWRCRDDTLATQQPYLAEGARRLQVVLHTTGPKKRKAGKKKPLGYRTAARKRPIAPCCSGRPWYVWIFPFGVLCVPRHGLLKGGRGFVDNDRWQWDRMGIGRERNC